MTDLDQKQLGKTLWNIADQLRGAMNADDFRDYMLSFLFLRYLSDNYEAAAKKELGRTTPTRTRSATADRSPLSVWYAAEPRRCGGRSRSRCAARCTTSSSPSTSGAASSTWPDPGRRSCSTRCRRASSTSRTNRSRALPGVVLGDQPRFGQAGTQAYADRNAKLCTIISRSPRGWRISRPTSTRWATPTNT